MSQIPISEAESIVMQALWANGEATAEDIVAHVAAPNDWQEATVKTLINRLLTKGAISAEKDGRRYRYRPLLRQDDWVTEESSSLIGRLFGGRVSPLVAHFSAQGKLSRSDIDEIRRLIEDLDHAD
jgi:predicted transcriptional regulator